MRPLLLKALPPAVLFVVALIVRLMQHHTVLLYPDGYQYLLMARGIAEHLQPTTTLGLGGDHFVPNPDAAAKPLFPLLVAAVHVLGVSWLDAARIVTVTAGATAVLAVSLLAARLSGSWLAGSAAGLLLLASPSLGLWSGFSGPDPLAQALALAAALAFVERRTRLGGVLTGLAVATRPELAVVAALGATVWLRRSDTRPLVKSAAVAAALTLSVVMGALRTPIAPPDLRLVSIAVFGVGIAAAVAVVPRLAIPATVTALGGVAFVGMLTVPGLTALWRSDWPLLGSAVAGFALLVTSRAYHRIAVRVLTVGVALGAIYAVKNPELERYFALELPLAALLAGIAITVVPSRARASAAVAVALAVAAGFMHPIPGTRDRDVFSAVARKLTRALSPGDSLLTAAPDAYGFWLPTERVHAMRPGERGYVLLDAAQRSYAPWLTGHGRVVARYRGDLGFSRPDGEIDPGSAVLVAGAVVAAPASHARPHKRG